MASTNQCINHDKVISFKLSKPFTFIRTNRQQVGVKLHQFLAIYLWGHQRYCHNQLPTSNKELKINKRNIPAWATPCARQELECYLQPHYQAYLDTE